MEIRPILSALLRSKTGAILIAAQVALTLAIVTNALYVVNDRLAIAARPSGVDEGNVFQINYNGFREIDDQVQMQKRDVEVLRAIPGVVSVAWTNQLPMTQDGWGMGLSVDSTQAGVGAAAYFSPDPLVETLGLKLVEGRDFDESDMHEYDQRVSSMKAESVIITRQLGGRLFPDEASYVGKTVWFSGGGEPLPLRIVGVVDQLMTPFAQNSDNAYNSFILPIRFVATQAQYAVHTEPGQLGRVMAEAEKALTGLRHDRVLLNNRSMAEIRNSRYRNQIAVAGMLVAVTIGLLIVTASGIVGMASLWVGQRRKQIGTRRALGATRGQILRYFITENVMITGIGIVAGAGLAIALNLLLVEQIALARLPLSYVAAGMAVLLALGVAAVLGPAYRAAAVPPAVATRGA